MSNKVVLDTDSISFIVNDKSIGYKNLKDTFEVLKIIGSNYNRINIFLYKDSKSDKVIKPVGEIIKMLGIFDKDIDKKDVRFYFLVYRTTYLSFEIMDNLLSMEPTGVYNLGTVTGREPNEFYSFYIETKDSCVFCKVLKEYTLLYLRDQLMFPLVKV